MPISLHELINDPVRLRCAVIEEVFGGDAPDLPYESEMGAAWQIVTCVHPLGWRFMMHQVTIYTPVPLPWYWCTFFDEVAGPRWIPSKDEIQKWKIKDAKVSICIAGVALAREIRAREKVE